MNERRNSTPRTALAARLRGFTVTELVVVVAVIAVVIAIVIPTVGKVRASARTVKCLSNQRQVTLACYAYAMANSSKLINPRTDYGGMAYVDGANLSMSAAGWKHVFVRALNETGHTGGGDAQRPPVRDHRRDHHQRALPVPRRHPGVHLAG